MGTVFGARELTLAEYERVETAYIAAFIAFADDSDVERLQIRSLESGAGLAWGELISVDEAVGVVRRMLREDVICKLETPNDDFALHVGFDLYMYVGSTQACARATECARELGLFVEHGWTSPQIQGEE